MALFQIDGILQCEMQELKRLARKAMPDGPKCFKKMGARWSGPNALELLDFLMAVWT